MVLSLKNKQVKWEVGGIFFFASHQQKPPILKRLSNIPTLKL